MSNKLKDIVRITAVYISITYYIAGHRSDILVTVHHPLHDEKFLAIFVHFQINPSTYY